VLHTERNSSSRFLDRKGLRRDYVTRPRAPPNSEERAKTKNSPVDKKYPKNSNESLNNKKSQKKKLELIKIPEKSK